MKGRGCLVVQAIFGHRKQQRMIKVGLTGSIAVGKTFVCDVFRELGCHVLDADRVARDVVEAGTPGLTKIIEEFGPEILTAAGGLDRTAGIRAEALHQRETVKST